ncbi:MAG: polyprenyl synthetase family protein [Clostridiales bacterium]|nr:polyprenyl synthetase family protein [Clostridiales bacterium]
MDKFSTIEEIYKWKADELSEIKNCIREAIIQSSAHESLKSILLDVTGNSGKMIRPMLVLLAAGDYRPEFKEKLLWGAASGELLHVSSLLLDDIIDEAETRRGKPSVQKQYGKAVAICAGTFLMVTSYSCLIERGYDDLAEDMIHLTQIVSDGEMLQDENCWNTGISEETYRKIIEGKTASVFSHCCRIAARITEQSGQNQKLLSEIGMNLGIMFQIRDDILDWTKDEKELGKPVGEDFCHGIFTLPFIKALQNTDTSDELKALIVKKENISKEDFEKAKKLVASSGGIEESAYTLKEMEKQLISMAEGLSGSCHNFAFRLLTNRFSTL